MKTAVESPFGGKADLVQIIPCGDIIAMYRWKCSVDIGESFGTNSTAALYRCPKTQYLFWRPSNIAGGEAFYRTLNAAWPNYYRRKRWEYSMARTNLRGSSNVLEVGCGRGYFLRSIEGIIQSGFGLELNQEAIAQRVTTFPIASLLIEDIAKAEKSNFDAVCSFQVLEHLVDPASFLEAALACLRPRGKLILSVPNHDYVKYAKQNDAFDLPPRHMGHFSKTTFHKIANLYGLELKQVEIEPRHYIAEEVTKETSSQVFYKTARLFAKAALGAAYRLCSEPGPNIFVVLQKVC